MHPLLERLLIPGAPSALRQGQSPGPEDWRALASLSALGAPADAEAARYVVRQHAVSRGVRPASIAAFYAARARGEVASFTVPAVNVRGMTFDIAAALFRAVIAHDGVAIFEINRAELGFTGQTPAEFATSVLAAACAEGYDGPVFLQADHMMLNAAAFAADPAAEVDAVWKLMDACIAASFWNIDIDASTLVDLSFARVEDQQRVNAEVTADLARRIRGQDPDRFEISIGGEIGEVGSHNTTVEELTAYCDQVLSLYPETRLRKVSVQTGTKHGGVVLPDGTIADVNLDFETLREISRVGRERYGMAGAVQHGASTLPEELFSRFPAVETAEVHLATGFQSIVFDHPAFPLDLRAAMEAHARAHLGADRKAADSEAQFLHSARRKLWGPFKAELWSLETPIREAIGLALEERFRALQISLGVQDFGRMAKKLAQQSV
ncbi:MAG: class II fructose-bisphosphate aldolase [Dehalococcoidia bacterium]